MSTTPVHEGYCYPSCGCPESEAFDWDGFAADINGTDPEVTSRPQKVVYTCYRDSRGCDVEGQS